MPYRFAPTVTAGQKTGITSDYAIAKGWTATVPNPALPGQTMPNPINKAKWLDNKVDAHVRAVVREYRLGVARQAAEAAALADMTGLEEL